jgi:predicted nucleotide-binding protein (sugar kinase/HSP70/actin superfamily)
MRKIAFPHLGNFYIPFKSLLAELGAEPVAPPFTSQRTIALGAKLSPEFACLPFKVILGNCLEAMEAGAECIMMIGGSGPCRLGYFGEIQREILMENGYPIDFIVLEAPQNQPWQFRDTIKHYIPRRRLQDFVRAWQIFWEKAQALDSFERMCNRIRPLEAVSGTCTKILDRFYTEIDQASTIKHIRSVSCEFAAELKEIPQKTAPETPKLILLGEIYTVLEPRINFQIEQALGSMGVEVKRTAYITDWIRENFILKFVKPGFYRRRQLIAKPYLKNKVGGYGLESVAHTVESGINHYDGIIHLAPFTCMPEIVAKQIIPTIANELSIPVLAIIIDEHSAAAGIQTRLEAFVDLIRFRNRQKKKPRKET